MPPAPEALPGLDARVPAWDTDALEERMCPFCGAGGDARWIRPDRLVVRACDDCGACFVSPAPPESRIEEFYRDYHGSRSASGHVRGDTPVADALREAPRSDIRVAEIDSTIDLRGRRLLDVGCGSGIALHRFRALGAEVSGIDPDPAAVAFVRDTLGIPDVAEGTPGDLPAGARYDVITIFDVIEHVGGPLDMLRGLAVRLEPGGLLAIWTPDASFSARDPAPLLFRVDLEHLQYLSTRTCLFLAGRLGLEIVHMESVGFPFLDEIPRVGEERVHRREGLRRIARSVPGFRWINARRRSILRRRSPPPDPRAGSYHLFCICRRRAGRGRHDGTRMPRRG